jgi:hypothetical protein
MYAVVRKFALRHPEAEVHQAVTQGLLPLLREAPGFYHMWSMRCSDGDHAVVVLFDSAEAAAGAQQHVEGWSEEHTRMLLVLPPSAMFDGTVEKVE